jgi:cation-transporting ATPase 13A3/4/5
MLQVSLGNIVFIGITLSIPPEFPVVLSMGTIFSLAKLKNKNIYCINPEKIRSSGRVSIMVFDKTGTLTEGGLSTHSFIVHDGEDFLPEIMVTQPVVHDMDIWLKKETYMQHKEDHLVKYAECKASCHSIALFKDEFIGDTLDIEMFKSSGWIFKEENQEEGNQIGTNSIYPK